MDEQGVELGRPAGRIKVSPSAIAGVVSAAVLQCYGVVGIAGRRIRGGRAEMLSEDRYEQGIAVAMEGETVSIDVYVVVEYGTRISEVAHNIINTVGAAVRRTLGAVPVRVNVNVQGLRIST